MHSPLKSVRKSFKICTVDPGQRRSYYRAEAAHFGNDEIHIEQRIQPAEYGFRLLYACHVSCEDNIPYRMVTCGKYADHSDRFENKIYITRAMYDLVAK